MAGIDKLNALLQAVLHRPAPTGFLAAAVSADVYSPQFVLLEAASAQLKEKFDRVAVEVPPASEKRRKALQRFAQAQQLNTSEWRYVFAGLSDPGEQGQTLLQDDAGFARVHARVDGLIDQRELKRRDWLALCFSYFACEEEEPQRNPNWQTLRRDIDRGFDAVRAQQGREKAWMAVVQEHRDLFGEQPGESLAEEMWQGRAVDLERLESIAQVPGSSWLWRSIFAVLLSRILMLDEAQFLLQLPRLLKLSLINPVHESPVIAACLTRYAQTRQRGEPHAELLDLAMDRWGSPQMRTRQNRWLQHVDDSVCAMVVGWLAKQDLKHFFTLLDGEAGVDSSRLFFWLRYAEQMRFTRIVLGRDALNNQSTDYAEFRAKNRLRLSTLSSQGGTNAANNAVIMQLGEYYFVEFSATGNACYVYRAENAPFDPTAREFSLTQQLKQKTEALDTWRHSPRPYSANTVTGWLESFDAHLAYLNIFPEDHQRARIGRAQVVRPSTAATAKVAGAQPHLDWPQIRTTAPISSPMGGSRAQDGRLQQLHQLLQTHLGNAEFEVMEQPGNSGAVQVTLTQLRSHSDQVLRSLGFKPRYGNPLIYWKS